MFWISLSKIEDDIEKSVKKCLYVLACSVKFYKSRIVIDGTTTWTMFGENYLMVNEFIEQQSVDHTFILNFLFTERL